MLSHITTDLHKVYLEEVFTPQLGKPGASTPTKPKSSSDIDGDGDVDSFEKKVRQLIYDVRHIMKEKKVPAVKAFQMRSSKTNYSAEIIKTAKEKLGIIGGPSTSVSEESTDRMVTVTINYKNGTIDRRNVPYSEVSQLRSKPTISSVEVSSNKVSYPGAGEKYEKNYGKGGQNTVGDRDRDGTKEPDRHEYAGVRDTAIKKSMSRKKKLKGYGVSEGFSNWREDLKEVAGIDDTITSRDKKQVKEKPGLDNHTDKTVVINPNFEEEVEILGGTIVESFELNEEYISEAVDIATEFFYNYGLNENGVDIVIEELGEEKFAEFVFDLSEEYFLIEARSAKKRKGGKSYEEIKAEIDAKESARKKVTADKTKKAVETAKQTQAPSSEPRKKSVKDRVARFILTGIERDRAARKTASELAGQTAQTLKKAASVGSKAASEFGKGFSSGVRGTATVAQKTKKAVVGEEYIEEKSESEQQQKLFGLALSVKRGETPRSEVSAEVLKIVDTMSEKKIRDFAKTPHSDVPKKVNEAIANSTRKTQKETDRIQVLQKMLKIERRKKGLGEEMEPQTAQQISARNLELRAEKMRISADQKAIQDKKKKQQEPGVQNQSYEPEGDVIDEEMPRRAKGPKLPGTRTFTGMGYYGRRANEKKDPKSMKPIFPEPKENQSHDEDDRNHPSLTPSQRNRSLR